MTHSTRPNRPVRAAGTPAYYLARPAAMWRDALRRPKRTAARQSSE